MQPVNVFHPFDHKSCDIIIVTYNQLDYSKTCLESIKKNTHGNKYRVIFVDNNSTDGTQPYLADLCEKGEILLIQNRENQGWVKGVNTGIAASKADYLCVMNNDTLVYPGWLEEMISVAEKDKTIGLVNPQWVFPRYCRGEINAYARKIAAKYRGSYIETDWVRGFCFLIKRQVIEIIGGLDTTYSPGYYDDWDFSVRAIRAGFKCAIAEGAFVWHHKNITFEKHFGKEIINTLLAEKGRIFHSKWGIQLKILVVSDNTLTAEQLGPEIRLWLNKQHRVLFVGPGDLSGLRHTNLAHKRGIFTFIFLLSILLDNYRHSKAKHFDAVICSEKMKRVLLKIPLIRKGYRIFTPGNDVQSSGLTQRLDELSKERTSVAYSA